MMYRSIGFVVFFLLLSFFAYSQKSTEFVKSGSPIIKVFANYHTNFSDVSKLEIKRSYFGYSYNLSKLYSVKVIFDVGENNGRYSSFLKIAQLRYKTEHLKIELGMIATKQFKVQEKFWDYRYLLKSFQDEYGFNASADLGISAEYKVSDKLSIDAIIQNGEGYKHVESTQTFRGGFGITFIPVKAITTRLYYDMSAKPAIKRQNLSAFVAYKYKKKLRLSVEYNTQLNHDFVEAKDYSGISLYSTYVINPKMEVFVRYDQLNLSLLNGEIYDWGKLEDGRNIISGFQFSPVSGVHISANYRGFIPGDGNSNYESMIFLNFEYKIK